MHNAPTPPFPPPASEAVVSGPSFPSISPGGGSCRETICRTAENHPINWAEGRTLHAAELVVIVPGKKAVAAMTCTEMWGRSPPYSRTDYRPIVTVALWRATQASRSGARRAGIPQRDFERLRKYADIRPSPLHEAGGGTKTAPQGGGRIKIQGEFASCPARPENS